MLIDWFTVGAQALNFAILVWLMQRYLYRPVLDAIDAREKRIAAEVADAAAKTKRASDERDEFLRKNTVFDAERAGLLVAATDEAAAEGKRLRATAAHVAAAEIDKRHDAVRDEVVALQHALGLRIRQEVFAVARQTLADLASANLDERICGVFLDRLRALDGTARDDLTAAVATATEPVTLRSAFVLADAQRATAQQVFAETFATKMALRFETAPDLVAGIEMRAGGQRLEWSISHHLDGLEKSVDALLTESGTTAGTQADPTALATATATAAGAATVPATATAAAEAEAEAVARSPETALPVVTDA